MTHDPLCYAIDKLWAQEADGSWRCMDCAFIAKVRADALEQAAHRVERNGLVGMTLTPKEVRAVIAAVRGES